MLKILKQKSKKIIFRLKETLNFAFIETPLFFIALFFLFGIFLHLAFHFFFLFICVAAFCCLLIILEKHRPKLFYLFFLTFLAGYLETSFFYPRFVYLEEKTAGEAIFKINSILQVESYGKNIYLYKGFLKNLKITSPKNQKSNEKVSHSPKLKQEYARLPCTLYCRQKARLQGNFLYKIKGQIKSKGQYYYSFKAENINPLKSTWSLAEKRYQLHQKIEKLLQKKIKNKAACYFLSGQMTGFTKSNFWRFIFAKTGLQHILAISGFHFMALILFFSFFLKRLLLAKFLPWCLLLIATLYALYIGPSTSVQRAWIALAAALLAPIFGKNYSGLNILSLGLILELAFEPLSLTSVSFQLSFLSVAAILLLYAPIDQFLSRFLKRRKGFDLKTLPFVEKAGAFLINYLRSVLSISLAVNLCLIPLILFYFHKFPWLSLAYNLFFPAAVSLAFYLTMLALITLPISFLSNGLFWTSDHLTAFFLNLLAAYPKPLDFALRAKNFSYLWVIFWLFILFFSALLMKYQSKSLLQKRPLFRTGQTAF